MKTNIIEIISPSDDLTKIPFEATEQTRKKLEERTGLQVRYAKNLFKTYSPERALEDLYEAYKDDNVGLVMCYKGGELAKEIIDKIDYNIIKQNQKPMIGYSDNTLLLDSIYLKTGQKNYYGSVFSSFNMDLGFDFTLNNFNKVVRDEKNFEFNISNEYSFDRKWYKNQNDRNFIKNEQKLQVINSGELEGTIIGGHLSSFNYLLSNGFKINDDKVVLIVEEDGLEKDNYFEKFKELLQAVINKVGIKKISGILIGRSQFSTHKSQWTKVVRDLNLTIPVVCNLDFGHSNPTLSIPIGEKIKLKF